MKVNIIKAIWETKIKRTISRIDKFNIFDFIEIDENTILEYKTLKVNTLCSDKAGYQRIKTITECKSAAMALGKPGKTVDLIPIEIAFLTVSGCS